MGNSSSSVPSYSSQNVATTKKGSNKMKKKAILVGLYVLGLVVVGAYCFHLGSVTQTTTYHADQVLCVKACKPNDNVSRLWTDFHCVCGNGASFNADDLRP
jgi:hypothetical protein